jgi:predicted PurR-regulated permease PerM
VSVPSAPPGRRFFVEYAFGLLALGVLVGLSFTVVSPFLGALAWAVILAVPAWPLAERLTIATGGRRRLVALGISFGLFVVLALPVFYLGGSVRQVAPTARDAARSLLEHGLPPPPAELVHVPLVGAQIEDVWVHASEDVPQLLEKYKSSVFEVGAWTLEQTKALLGAMVEIVLGIVIAGALLATGPAVRRFVRDLAFTLGGHEGLDGLEVAGRALMGVALGVVGTSLLQALLAAAGYALAGLSAAPFLALLIFVFALLQVGPVVVWVPLVAWIAWQGDLGRAVFVAVWSLVAVQGADAIVKPLIMARTARLSTLLLFVGVLGGLLAWGFTGMFIGAASLSVAWTLLQRWLQGNPAPEEGQASPGVAPG